MINKAFRETDYFFFFLIKTKLEKLQEDCLSKLWPLVSLAEVLPDLIPRAQCIPHLIPSNIHKVIISIILLFLPRNQCTGMFYSIVAFKSSGTAEREKLTRTLSLTLLSELSFTSF